MSFGCNCRAIHEWNPAAKVEHTAGCPLMPNRDEPEYEVTLPYFVAPELAPTRLHLSASAVLTIVIWLLALVGAVAVLSGLVGVLT